MIILKKGIDFFFKMVYDTYQFQNVRQQEIDVLLEKTKERK